MNKKTISLVVVALSFFIFALLFSTTFSVNAASASTDSISINTTTNSDQKTDGGNLGSRRISEGINQITYTYENEDGENETSTYNVTVDNLRYIKNANYFFANPKHHSNIAGESPLGLCSTVALQILIGYHNYYSDRRMLPEVTSAGVRFLSENYGDYDQHPDIFFTTASGYGRESIGTTDELHDELLAYADALLGPLGPSVGLGQMINYTTAGARNFLQNYSPVNVKSTIEDALYSEIDVKAELEEGRPVVLGLDPLSTGAFHMVVAYGYATVDNEFGYIAHWGWSSNNVQMWIPASAVSFQVKMHVDHSHNFVSNGTMPSGDYKILLCTTCGCATMHGAYADYFAGGDGINTPYLISTAEQFKNMQYAYRSVYVSGQGTESHINYWFKLTNNITLPGDWTPFNLKFSGIFDGDDHSITYSMVISESDLSSDLHGLFSYIANPGEIKNLELKNCSITTSNINTELSSSGSPRIGILAGFISKARGIESVKITNPTISVNIFYASVGGIAGSLQQTYVTNCEVTGGSLTNYDGPIGGMAGNGTINYFSGGKCATTITKKNYSDSDLVGPIVGNSQNTSTVESTSTINKEGSCIASGTLITLADGTQKPVEELTGNELLLVWNLETGSFDTAPILFIDSDPQRTYRIIHLAFSDGTNVSVISEHGFWDYTLNQYVYLDENATDFIGHSFAKQTVDCNGSLILESVQLISVSITQETASAYSPVTAGHLCYYVNGMLSMPGGAEGLFNILEVDATTMQYDQSAKAADIAQYGLYTYEEFSAEYPVSEEVFNAFNGQYLKIAFGKELLTQVQLENLLERYAEFLN